MSKISKRIFVLLLLLYSGHIALHAFNIGDTNISQNVTVGDSGVFTSTIIAPHATFNTVDYATATGFLTNTTVLDVASSATFRGAGLTATRVIVSTGTFTSSVTVYGSGIETTKVTASSGTITQFYSTSSSIIELSCTSATITGSSISVNGIPYKFPDNVPTVNHVLTGIGNNELSWLPVEQNIIPSAGALTLYLYEKLNMDVGSGKYETLLTTPSTNTEAFETVSVNNGSGFVMLSSHAITNAQMGFPTKIPAGEGLISYYAKVSNPSGITYLLFKCSTAALDGVTGKWVFHTSTGEEINNTSDYINYNERIACAYDLPLTTSTAFILEVYAKTDSAASRTVSFIYEGDARASFVRTSIPQLGASLEDLQNTVKALNASTPTYLVDNSTGTFYHLGKSTAEFHRGYFTSTMTAGEVVLLTGGIMFPDGTVQITSPIAGSGSGAGITPGASYYVDVGESLQLGGTFYVNRATVTELSASTVVYTLGRQDAPAGYTLLASTFVSGSIIIDTFSVSFPAYSDLYVLFYTSSVIGDNISAPGLAMKFNNDGAASYTLQRGVNGSYAAVVRGSSISFNTGGSGFSNTGLGCKIDIYISGNLNPASNAIAGFYTGAVKGINQSAATAPSFLNGSFAYISPPITSFQIYPHQFGAISGGGKAHGFQEAYVYVYGRKHQ